MSIKACLEATRLCTNTQATPIHIPEGDDTNIPQPAESKTARVESSDKHRKRRGEPTSRPDTQIVVARKGFGTKHGQKKARARELEERLPLV